MAMCDVCGVETGIDPILSDHKERHVVCLFIRADSASSSVPQSEENAFYVDVDVPEMYQLWEESREGRGAYRIKKSSLIPVSLEYFRPRQIRILVRLIPEPVVLFTKSKNMIFTKIKIRCIVSHKSQQ